MQKLEGRVATDEDLKLSDLFRYYDRDSQAALVRKGKAPLINEYARVFHYSSPSRTVQDLLYRRMRSLANYEAANKKLETAKTKSKGVPEVSACTQLPPFFICTHCVFRQLCVIAYLLGSLVGCYKSWVQ